MCTHAAVVGDADEVQGSEIRASAAGHAEDKKALNLPGSCPPTYCAALVQLAVLGAPFCCPALKR